MRKRDVNSAGARFGDRAQKGENLQPQSDRPVVHGQISDLVDGIMAHATDPRNEGRLPQLAWSPREVARKTSLSIGFIRGEIRNGRLRALKIRARIIVPVDRLKEYLLNNAVEVGSGNETKESLRARLDGTFGFSRERHS